MEAQLIPAFSIQNHLLLRILLGRGARVSTDSLSTSLLSTVVFSWSITNALLRTRTRSQITRYNLTTLYIWLRVPLDLLQDRRHQRLRRFLRLEPWVLWQPDRIQMTH
jgi:hypothetical protein